MLNASKDLVVSNNESCPPLDASYRITKQMISLTKKLAQLKSQELLLLQFGDLDLFSSIRPKIGKHFTNPTYEKERDTILEESRKKLIIVGLKEKRDEIAEAEKKLNQLEESAQKLTLNEYIKLCGKLRSEELKLSQSLTENIERKVNYYNERQGLENPAAPLAVKLQTKKRRKHQKTQRMLKKKYKKCKKKRKQDQKRKEVEKKVSEIKKSNLVRNFSNEDVPDEVYLYLALGSNFCQTTTQRKHDYVYDAKEFCRKLAWKAYFENRRKETANEDSPDQSEPHQVPSDDICGWSRSQKLNIKSRSYPEYNDNLLTHVTDQIKDAVNKIVLPKHQRNLTLLEAKGQRWCKKAVQDRRLYITKVDKGGCLLILNADDVDKIMHDTLNDSKKFEKLDSDPRDGIKKDIKDAMSDYAKKNLLSRDDLFDVTGLTKRGGMSHGREFIVGKPHMYPLFKIHKLNQDQILSKVIPPTRMVTSGVGGPTFRLGTFLDTLLKPVVQKYCHNEVVRDSTDFLKELKKCEVSGEAQKMKLIGTLDVDALYPSIRLDIAIKALRDALNTVTSFSSEQIEMIIYLANLCITNSVVHYRGAWYKILEGIPTGGPESGSIANIVVYYVFEKILLPHPKIASLNKISSRKRFLDDFWFGWLGTMRQFSLFQSTLNEIGSENGMTFKGEVGRKVDFLDVTVELGRNGKLTTCLFVKPTDASRYLHRRSDHGPHTFRSIPFSQFRRAIMLCSEKEKQEESIDYMSTKLRNSGYKADEIQNARDKALQLDRDAILNQKASSTEKSKKQQLIFTVNRDQYMSTKVKEVLKNHQEDIDKLVGGPTQLIVAERRNANTASLLFAKSSFSKEVITPKASQKCDKQVCKLCKIMNLPDTVTLWKNHPRYQITLSLDFRCNCSSDNIMYLYICKWCKNNESFYVGQSVNTCRKRAYGHRAKFNERKYKKSALSYHIFNDHPEKVNGRLKNYDLGILKATSPGNLDRLEDYYIDVTHAKLSLNRYKTTQ